MADYTAFRSARAQGEGRGPGRAASLIPGLVESISAVTSGDR